ncbi:MAG: CHASE2 domain-containing protein [Candidatus Riflebacteria bacterium]|nr:CHASE2 domain-containing protein [Candidatus Riflebacteria bacterium]
MEPVIFMESRIGNPVAPPPAPASPPTGGPDAAVGAWVKRLETMVGRKRLLGWAVGLGAILLVIVLLPSLGAGLDRAALDLVTRLATPWRSPHPDLEIVGIDTPTLAAVPDRWPWPRDRYARLLEAVASAGPRLIVLDLLLQHPEESDGGAGDRALAATLRRLGNVQLISLLEQKETAADLLKRHFRSAPVFREAAAGEGFVWSWVDPDGVVRSFVLRDDLLDKDSCVLDLARRLCGAALPVPPPEEQGLSRSLVAFAGRGGMTPIRSALDFLEGRVPPDSLAGKVVFLGATAPILHDVHRTGLGLLPGTFLLAATLDTLLQGRLTTRPTGRAWRLGLALLGAVLGAWVVGRSPVRPWAALLAGLLACGTVWTAVLLAGTCCLPLFPLVASFLLAGLAAIALLRLLELLAWQALQAEAAAAGLVQRQLFPPPAWQDGEFVSFGCCQPCSAAGGDYFDAVQLGEQDRLFLVNDVAGHGIGAAMVASMLKSAIASLQGQQGFSLEQAVERLNALLYRLFHGRKMVTGVFCRLETRTRRLTLVSAGHVVSLIVRADGKVDEVGLPGLPLGVRPTTRLHMVPLALHPGDTLVMYTDGVVETVDWEDQALGYPAWKSLLAARAPLVPDAVTVDGLLADVRAHARGYEATDDVTLLLLHRRAGPSGPETTLPTAPGGTP